MSSFSKWIKLNVGGKSFQTTLTTLTSCPDSLLAKMFDPDSSLEPAYSEDGVYFLDANPKYFSIILDWLRYREVLADSDIKLGDVAKVANFFGLEELADKLKKRENEEELKKVDNELKKAGIGSAVIFVSDEGEAAEHVGDHMGLFLKEGDGMYRQAGSRMHQFRQAGGGLYEYYADTSGIRAWMNNRKLNFLPRGGWFFFDKNRSAFKFDLQCKAIDLSEFKFCNSVTLSSTKCQHNEFLGEFRRVPGDWLNGWPVFKNQEGNYLRVATRTSCWSVNSVRDTAVNEEDKLSSNRVTSCPAHAKAGTSDRDGVYHWRYGHGKLDETLKVTCDVHGSSAQ